MPVRSKGRLLAGLAALVGLCWAGAGCQTAGPGDPFAIRAAGSRPAVATSGSDPGKPAFGALPGAEPPSRLARFWHTVTGRETTSPTAGSPAAPASPTVVASSDDAFAIRQGPQASQRRRLFNFGRPEPAPAPPAGSPAFAPAVTAPVVSQSVPVARVLPPGTIIATSPVASTWQPVQRVSAEEAGAAAGSGATPAFTRLAPEAAPTAIPTVGQPPAELPLGGDGPTMIASSGGPALGAGPDGADKDAAAADKDKPKRSDEPVPANDLPAPRVMVADPLAGPFAGAIPGGLPPVPRELRKRALSPYIIEPPDILLVELTSTAKIDQPIRGQHIVSVDGFVRMGRYGNVYVAGLTVEQARDAIVRQLRAAGVKQADPRSLNVDVLAYNSKFYYVITDGGGYGEQVYRFSITGNETVLDALSQINGLPPVASKKKMWLARASEKEAGPPKILPIDWRSVTQCGQANTNYQLFPGDRIYVAADCWIRTDSFLAKRLSPIQRMLGVTLLGASTVNAIKFGTSSGLGGLGGLSGGIR